MKHIISFISVFVSISFLLSCNNDDDDISIPQKNHPWYWGYFEGEINGEKISLKDPRNSESDVIFTGYDYYLSDDSRDSVKGLWTAIHYTEDHNCIHVDLYNPYVGVRYMTSSNKDWKKTGGIYITKFGKPNTTEYYLDDYYYYYPNPQKPFKMEILSTFYEDFHPIVKVKMDGVLYCKDNPEDSIVVKGTYGNKVYDGTDNF